MESNGTRDFSFPVHLEIPNGYRLNRRVQAMELEAACALLRTKKRRRYTCAVKKGGIVELVRELVVCPACGHESPSYNRPLMPIYGQRDAIQRPATKEVLEAWTSRQMTFFEETQALHFRQFNPPGGAYECPQCLYKSHPFTGNIPVVLIHRRHKLTVRQEVTSLADILSIPWLRSLSFAFPIWEEFVFNFRNGRTYIQLVDQVGEKLAVYDLTSRKNVNSVGAFHFLFQNTRLRRMVKKAFELEWRSKLPFSEQELDLPHLMLLTEFIGYPKTFYYAIPYARGTYGVDPLFRKERARLHRAVDIPQLYRCSALPQAKSVRRFIFQNPAVLFYQEECQRLCKLVDDLNLFCRLLASPSLYLLLAALKAHPGIFSFFEDYVQVKGGKGLLDKVLPYWGGAFYYALHYCTLSKGTKNQEQIRWRKKDFHFRFRITMSPFSLPMPPIHTKIHDCTINGYRFFWLKNSSDYYNTSQELHNCLDTWGPYNNPVICAAKNQRALAAIEVKDGSYIVQAQLPHNCFIKEGTPLYAAYRIWRRKYGLQDLPNGDEGAV